MRATPDAIAWLRADCAARDAVTAAANRAFDRAFRRALRRLRAMGVDTVCGLE